MRLYQITISVKQLDDGKVEVGSSCNDPKIIALVQAQMLNFASQSLLDRAYQDMNAVSEKLVAAVSTKEGKAVEQPRIVVPGQTVPFPAKGLDT